MYDVVRNCGCGIVLATTTLGNGSTDGSLSLLLLVVKV